MQSKTTKSKQWLVFQPDAEKLDALASELRVHPNVAAVFLARGLDTKFDYRYLCDGEVQYSPNLLPDMHLAVDRIVEAINRHDTILVHGDSDCDGICSAGILTTGLQSLGGDVICHVPNRITDGFGLNSSAVNTAKSAGVSLIITVDCGTEAIEAAECAKRLGLDLIITDHHLPKSCGLPTSIACVNPKRNDSIYPFPDLAGVGVAYKLLLAVTERFGYDKNIIDDMCLPLVALGTVADCVDVTEENHTLIKLGLRAMGRTNMTGLKELITVSGVKSLDTEAIGFFIAPMINAACRLGCPEYALRLLLESEPVMARLYAHRLKELNDERKVMQKQLEDEVFASLPENISEYPAIFCTGDYHPGLVGLVATKSTTLFGRPSFVGANSPNGDSVRGSCRSVPGLSVIAALESCSDILIKFGGHDMAAGFEVYMSDLERLEERLYDYFDGLNVVVDDSIYIDAEMPLAGLNLKTFEHLERLAPFGIGNLRPILATTGLTVAGVSTFGKNDAHLKLMLTDNNHKTIVPSVFWSHGFEAEQYRTGTAVDVAYNLTMDTYQKSPSVVLTVADIQLK